MAIIYSYPQAIPKGSDLIIGTVTYDPDDPSIPSSCNIC